MIGNSLTFPAKEIIEDIGFFSKFATNLSWINKGGIIGAFFQVLIIDQYGSDEVEALLSLSPRYFLEYLF